MDKIGFHLPARMYLLPVKPDSKLSAEAMVSQTVESLLLIIEHQRECFGNCLSDLGVTTEIVQGGRNYNFCFIFELDNGLITPDSLLKFRAVVANVIKSAKSVWN